MTTIIITAPESQEKRERLFQVLKELGVSYAEAQGPEKPEQERIESAFWNPKTLKELLEEQGVQPVDNLESLKVDFWPGNEAIESFLAYTRRERKDAVMRES